MKAVGESMEKPLLYYKNNLIGTINLLEVIQLNFKTFFLKLRTYCFERPMYQHNE